MTNASCKSTMDTKNEFVTRDDVNPLFRIRELRDTASRITDLVGSGSPLTKTDAELANENIHSLQLSLDHLLQFLRELAMVNEDLLRVVERAVASVSVDVDGGDKRSWQKDDIQDGLLSRGERARLQQHIPGFRTANDKSSGNPEIQKQILILKPQLEFLQKQLKTLLKEAYNERLQTPTEEKQAETHEKRRKRDIEREEQQQRHQKLQKQQKQQKKQEKKQEKKQQKNKKKRTEKDIPKRKPRAEKPPTDVTALNTSEKSVDTSSTLTVGTTSDIDHSTKQEVIQCPDADQDQSADASDSAIDAVARINRYQIHSVSTTIVGQLEAMRSKCEQDPEKLKQEREKRRLLYEEERRQYEKRRNPDNWPVLSYPFSEDKGVVSADVGCIIRVPESTNTRRLECYPRDVIVHAGPRELLASNVTSLATKDQEPIRFEFPALISLPYKPVPGLEPVVYAKEGQGNWMAVSTRHYVNEDVHMAQFERSTLQHLTFAVKMCAIRHYDVTSQRTVIEDPEQPSVRITVPEGVFKDEGEIRLKIINVDQMSEARGRLSDADAVDMLSVLCHIHGTGVREGAMHAEIGFNGESALPAILPPGHRVHLMTSSDGVKWTRNEPIRTADNRRYVREMRSDENDLWLLLVRTKGFFNPNETPRLARDILTKLFDLPVYVLLYQHKATPNRVQLQTCTPSTASSVLNQLEELGYTEGTAALVYVPDGSYLHIRPSAEGNIEFADDVKYPIILKHVACLDTGELAAPIQIKVRNKYIQKNHQVYTGKILVHNVISRITDGGSNSEKSKVFLCELPVVLPKEPEKEEEKPIIQQQKTFLGSEPLTADYLRQLAADLGDKCMEVLLRLGLSNITIHKVMSKWTDPEEAKFELFTIWYKRSNRNVSKISRLLRILREVGRTDLADDLHKKYDVIMEEKRLKNKEGLLSLLARRVATDPGALDDWKNILRSLSVEETKIAALEEERKPINRIYCLQQGLIHWLHTENNGSSPHDVYLTLKQLGHVAAADQVSRWLGMKN